MPPLNTFTRSALAVAIGHAVVINSLQAATITVDSTADDLDNDTNCTLRDAIATVNAGTDQNNGCVIDASSGALGTEDTIVFSSSVAGGNITLNGSELSIIKSVVINPDSANPSNAMTTIDANKQSDVIDITGGHTQINRLMVTGAQGGLAGVYLNDPSSGASFTANNSSISNNEGAFGGVATVSLSYVNSTITLNNTTVSGNSASFAGGGIAAQVAVLTLDNSTVSNNFSSGNGGGILGARSTITLNNTTVSGNTASTTGGGIHGQVYSDIILNNTTVSENSANNGGGIYSNFTTTTTLNNSIIANSISGGDCEFKNESIVIADNLNIIEDGSCNTSARNIDPALGPLADNGGPTLTHALLAGSPALNAGTNDSCTATDQRGQPRANNSLDPCDIGAFERQPASITVNINSDVSTDNDANCTLREAIATVNAGTLGYTGCAVDGVLGGANIIKFAPDLNDATVTLTQGELSIGSGTFLTIDGPDQDGPDQSGLVVDADNGSRVFNVNNATLAINDLTITGGSETYGGGILIGGNSTVGISNSTVARNLARFGGGISVDGNATVSISNSTVFENSANSVGVFDSGGGIFVDGNATVSISSSTVFGNSAILGGGIFVNSNSSSLANSVVILNNSTVSGNSATTTGGGVLAAAYSSVSLSNSTVSGNSSASGGGGIVAFNESSVSLSNSLISGNRAASNGDEFLFTLSTLISNGNNLFGDNANTSAEAFSYFTPAAGDIVATSDGNNPTALVDILSPLSDNGGPTQTHALPPGSPAIDAVTDCTGITTDQRGVSRPQGSACDIGSFELVSSLTVTIAAESVAENAGLTTGSVARTDTVGDLDVTLESSDTSEATVSNVTIPAGAVSANFMINLVDDDEIDGNQTVTITASAALRDSGSDSFVVTDDDDLDGDGIPRITDNCPVNANADQADFEGDGIGDVCDDDDDGDGMSDAFELANGLNPRNSSDRDADPDGDGFTNLEEFRFGTDPQVPDADENNNGVPDRTDERRERASRVLPIAFKLILLED